MSTYDNRPYIAPVPRIPGWHDVTVKVTWTPRGGEPVVAKGEFLDANDPAGPVFMGCGIEGLIEELELWPIVGDHLVVICDLVDRQLAERPWAEIRCPQGQARLDAQVVQHRA